MYSCCLLHYKYKALAKRLQHFNTTYRKNVGGSMLRAFGHPVVVTTRCNMLGVVGSNLKKVKFFMQHLTFNYWSRGEQ